MEIPHPRLKKAFRKFVLLLKMSQSDITADRGKRSIQGDIHYNKTCDPVIKNARQLHLQPCSKGLKT